MNLVEQRYCMVDMKRKKLSYSFRFLKERMKHSFPSHTKPSCKPFHQDDERPTTIMFLSCYMDAGSSLATHLGTALGGEDVLQWRW
jgi:hypothetical protein